jgi:phasin family protein
MLFQPTDFQHLLDAGQRAIAPLAELNALTARTLERTARYQYGVAGDLLELGVVQLQTTAAAKDLGTLLNQQAALANAFVEKSSARSREAVRLATEAQAEFSAWVGNATSEWSRKTA